MRKPSFTRTYATRQRSTKNSVIALIVLAALVPVLAFAWYAANRAQTAPADVPHVAIGPKSYPPTNHQTTIPHHRVYSVEKQSQGDMVMVADGTAAATPVTLLPNHFGSYATDAIAALTLAPGGAFLAIDGQQDHGDTVWIVDTASNQLRTVPGDASGNFLHWMPDGQHFLFKPFLPTQNVGTWNPGLWIVDASTGTHINLPLPANMPATDLVDAAPAPDGTRIILSVSAGLGQGSSVWMATPDGLNMQPLFTAPSDVGLFTWSPDGTQIAYETVQDSTVPFRPAGLWVMAPNATAQRELSEADGGHGFTPAWSPDGSQLAFVARLNATDSAANGTAGALVSAVQLASLATGAITTVAAPQQTGQPRNIDPIWQSDGTLLFTVMQASTGYGTAMAPSALWQATPTMLNGHGATQMQLAPLHQQLSTALTAFVTVVP
jgi:hypothetical protein